MTGVRQGREAAKVNGSKMRPGEGRWNGRDLLREHGKAPRRLPAVVVRSSFMYRS